MNLQEIASAVNGTVINSPADNIEIKDIKTDSRVDMTNGLFIPLVGEKFDGHNFIKSVYDKGAVATLTQHDTVEDSRLAAIKVQDTSKALLDLARYYRKQFDIPVVGITGSVGKTSTKDMIASVLTGKFNVHKTQGNFNNEIGLPLTLFALDDKTDVAVIEMGMNHFGEIHKLTTTALPKVAVITNIGTSHIENLGSREGILKAKLEILDGLDKDGVLVINGDNDLLKTVNVNVPTIKYGLDKSNDYYATDIIGEEFGTRATVTTPKGTYPIYIKALGEHMVYNTLAAIAVAEYFGLTIEEINKGLDAYIPTKMRMHIEKLDSGITIIDDTYNASADSMKAALKVLNDYNVDGNKIAVLGDMFEMGDFAAKLHEEVGDFAATTDIDILVTIGQLADNIKTGFANHSTKPVYAFSTKEEFIQNINNIINKNDCILFKASRGMHFETLIEEIRKVK